MLKKIRIILIWCVYTLPILLFKTEVYAAGLLSDTAEMEKQATELGRAAKFDTDATTGTLTATVGAIIKGFLSLLALIFIILMIIAGYNWMTAAGEEEKVRKAKDTIQRAIIGLLIIVASYAITYFVFKNLPGGGAGAGPGGGP